MLKKSDKILYEKAEFVFTNNTTMPQNLQLFDMNQLTFPTTPTFADSSFPVVFAFPPFFRSNILVDDYKDYIYYIYQPFGMSVYSTITHQLINTYNLFATPMDAFVLDSGRIIGWTSVGTTLSFIDTQTGALSTTVLLNHGITSIQSLTVVGNKFYITTLNPAGNVLVLDKNTLTELAWFPALEVVDIDNQVNNWVAFDGSRYIYFASNTFNGLGRIDTLTNSYVLIATGAIMPNSAVACVGRFVYFYDSAALNIVKYDTVNLTFTVITPIPAGAFVPTFENDSVNNLLYIVYSIAGNNFVSVINTVNDTLVYSLNYSAGIAGYGSYSPKYNTLFKTSSVTNFLYPTIYAPSISITGSINYEDFVRSIFNEPKRVTRIEVNANSISQVGQPVQIVVKDANGNSVYFTRLPNTTISVMQFNQTQANVDFKKDLILSNGNYINSYILGAGETVSLILYYKAVKMLELYGMSANLFPIAKENLVSQEELDADDSGRGAIFPATYLMSNPEVNNLLLDMKNYGSK